MKILPMILLVSALQSAAFAEPISHLRPVEGVTVKQIVNRMADKNRKRRQALQSYTGQRRYRLLYKGFPANREAELVVDVKYQAPDKKEFTVVSESGSHFMINHVFKKLLETEKEAADEKSQERTALTENNYDFQLLGQEEVDGRTAYALRVEPKTSNKLLYRGTIWVDTSDYAVCKIEGEPAKGPSFWISKTVVHHSYRKVGDFWLPAENESDTDVRLGGHATLSIHYGDYKVVARTQSPDSRTLDEQSVSQLSRRESDHSKSGRIHSTPCTAKDPSIVADCEDNIALTIDAQSN